MSRSHRKFVTDICTALDKHLQAAQRKRGAISILASGAAFESWLAFETRLLLENRNDLLPWKTFAVENERGKSDVYISDWTTGKERCHALLEFKLVYNNKNWEKQVDDVLADLYPARSSKRILSPAIPRLSIVGLVGKMYVPGYRYPGPIADLASWEKEVLRTLVATKPGAKCVWEGTRTPVKHEWLDNGYDNFVQLRAFTPASTGA